MATLKFIWTVALAALLAALAVVSGCTLNAPAGGSGHIRILTPTQTIEGDFEITPPATTQPANTAPASPAAFLGRLAEGSLFATAQPAHIRNWAAVESAEKFLK